MIRTITDSLSRRLAKEERERRSKLPDHSEGKSRGLLQILLFFAERPVQVGLILFVGAAVFSITSSLLPTDLLGIILLPPYDASSDPSSYFLILWSVQTAIVALVYPIVIALVTLLVARQATTKATLHVYLHDSGAQLAGLCAMLLVVEMTCQYMGLPYVSPYTAYTWILFDAVWFLFNLMLTIRFLYRTFEFIKPNRRVEITRAYAATVTWPRELQFHLAKVLFQGAVEAKLIPGTSFASPEKRTPKILLGSLGAGTGAPQVRAVLKRSRYLRDIYFRPLRLAIRIWLRKALAAQQASPNLARRQIRDPVLVFPLDPLGPYNGNVVLCSVEHGPKLGWIESLLIRLSFRFSHAGARAPDLTVEDILADIQSAALTFVRSGELEAFEACVREFVGVYESVMRSSETSDVEGRRISLLQIASRDNWLGRPLLETWNRRILELVTVACTRLSMGDDYLRYLVSVPNHLFASAQSCSFDAILPYFQELNFFVSHRIEMWWVGTLEMQQSEISHGPCRPAKLRAPFYAVHDTVLRNFVGSWETLKNYLVRADSGSKGDWGAIRQWGEQLWHHMNHTVAMLMDAVSKGDVNTAEWMTDVLIKWYSEMTPSFGDARHYVFQTELITLDHVLCGVDAVDGIIDWGLIEEGRRAIASLDAAIHNLWVDACCTVLYLLAVFSKQCECETSLPADLYSRILTGTPLRGGGEGFGTPVPCTDAEELLLCVLRQNFSAPDNPRVYRSRLDAIVERCLNLSKPEMVSGRSYGTFGSIDLNSTKHGQIVSLLLLTAPRMRMRSELDRVLKAMVYSNNQEAQAFSELLRGIQEEMEGAKFAESFAKNYECLKSKIGKGLDLEEARVKLVGRIESLRDSVAEAHDEALAAAKISEQRLKSVAGWFSMSAFSKETGAFPLPVFQEVSGTKEGLVERSLVIRQARKGELTDPPMVDLAVNEGEFYRDMGRSHVGISSLAKLIEEIKPEVVDGSTPELYWAQFRRYVSEAKENGFHPLLLLGRATEPAWVWNWAHPAEGGDNVDAPAALKFVRVEGPRTEGPLWLFNDVPVYAVPIPPGSSILLLRESLTRLQFSTTEDGRYVVASTRPIEDRTDVVDLVFTWKLAVTVQRLPAVKLQYG